MSGSEPPRTARAELAALAVSSASGEPGAGFAGLSDVPAPDGSRAAAVLILFGVLDSLASDHTAQSHAVSRDLDVLLLARASTLRAHPGQVAFPGGRIDDGDDGAVAAALREAREETGLDPAGVDVLGSLDTVPLAFSSHLVTPVIGWWRHPSPVRAVDHAESAAVFRAPVADLLDPDNRGITVVNRFGRVWRDPAFLVDDETGTHLVWGFTAMLLNGIFDRLGWTEPWNDSRELPLELPDSDSGPA